LLACRLEPLGERPAGATRISGQEGRGRLRLAGLAADPFELVYTVVDTLSTPPYSRVVRPIANIPSAPPFRLKNHQLAQVLCQIRFSTVLRINQDDAVIAFQEAIRHTYPRYAKQQGMTVLITPQGVQQQVAPSGQHRFDDSEGVFTAILTPDFVALETNQYADIEDFVSRVVTLAAAVEEHYTPAEIQRVGLRFINELRLRSADPKDEMREAITAALLGAAGSDELVDAVTSTQQVLELGGDDSRMLVRHGLVPQGGTTVDPLGAQIALGPEHQQPFYLMDIDAFSERNRRYSVEGIETTLREFNDDVRSFFAWSVNEEYRRTKLGQEDV
jgi:uncharacterized protein (TIGR04255 family)